MCRIELCPLSLRLAIHLMLFARACLYAPELAVLLGGLLMLRLTGTSVLCL